MSRARLKSVCPFLFLIAGVGLAAPIEGCSGNSGSGDGGTASRGGDESTNGANLDGGNPSSNLGGDGSLVGGDETVGGDENAGGEPIGEPAELDSDVLKAVEDCKQAADAVQLATGCNKDVGGSWVLENFCTSNSSDVESADAMCTEPVPMHRTGSGEDWEFTENPDLNNSGYIFRSGTATYSTSATWQRACSEGDCAEWDISTKVGNSFASGLGEETSAGTCVGSSSTSGALLADGKVLTSYLLGAGNNITITESENNGGLVSEVSRLYDSCVKGDVLQLAYRSGAQSIYYKLKRP